MNGVQAQYTGCAKELRGLEWIGEVSIDCHAFKWVGTLCLPAAAFVGYTFIWPWALLAVLVGCVLWKMGDALSVTAALDSERLDRDACEMIDKKLSMEPSANSYAPLLTPPVSPSGHFTSLTPPDRQAMLPPQSPPR